MAREKPQWLSSNDPHLRHTKRSCARATADGAVVTRLVGKALAGHREKWRGSMSRCPVCWSETERNRA